jgi:uncharacterized damage-inducible protein DinB
MSQPEAWLRGPVEGVPTPLQPVAHALMQALEESEAAIAGLDAAAIWRSPGGAATLGFHLRHMAGSLERLLTYARGEALSEVQRAALRAEKEATPEVSAAALHELLVAQVERALDQLRATAESELDQPRYVGRDRLPSSVRGLLHHAGEHAARHAGQVVTTAKIVRGDAP